MAKRKRKENAKAVYKKGKENPPAPGPKATETGPAGQAQLPAAVVSPTVPLVRAATGGWSPPNHLAGDDPRERIRPPRPRTPRVLPPHLPPLPPLRSPPSPFRPSLLRSPASPNPSCRRLPSFACSGATPGYARAFSSCTGLGLVLSPNSRSRRGPASSASRSPPRRPPTRPRLRRALLLLN